MGEKAKEALKFQFDKRLRLEFHGTRITSEGGLLVCRELDGVPELNSRNTMGYPGILRRD